jgi:hypothetical protein
VSWMASMLGLPSDTRLIVGVSDEPDADGSWRIYLNARYTGLHTHTLSAEQAEECRSYTRGHLYADVPADSLCGCPEEAAV